MMNIRKEIGVRIKARLYDLHMTQRQLAEACGLTEAAVSRYLNGQRCPKGVIIVRLAEALQTDPNYILLGREEE